MCIKIGIITYHFTINYGATLQAYALFKFLQSYGYDVEIIDYRPKSIRLEQRKYLYPKRYWINPNMLIKARKKVINMNKFLYKNTKISQKKFYDKNSLNEYNHLYDVVICGSDEIWNVNSTRGLDTPYFLDFINGEKTRKVSYAPSFGSTTDLGLNKEKVHNLLKDFHSISVRDNNSFSLINQSSLRIKKVVDPTFLINYENIMKVSSNQSKYILVYGSLDQKETQYVKTLAEQEGLDIIAIGAAQTHLKPFIKLDLYDIGPDDWLGYFYNASFVVTNFFHGLVFAIIFNKPFIVFSHPQKILKVRDILNPLGLENRLLNLNEKINQQILLKDESLLLPLLTNEQKNNLDGQIQISKDYLLYEALQ
ncbi:MAG: polysaccharide pyruvyl transferase family protein [Nostoc sp. ChiSLP01]|nr:polysaccharide pyruvyl transferase family protein [Nostoc sp. CmiSLP01]MDZ8287996.1 polysaccharide pyruvyl transferase family protein [Nostoc sp. ChiSLP01]